MFPPPGAATRTPGVPLAFDLVGRKPVWNPPILVAPGVMHLPTVEWGEDGDLSLKVTRITAAGIDIPAGMRDGIALTNGRQEFGLVLGEDGKWKPYESDTSGNEEGPE